MISAIHPGDHDKECGSFYLCASIKLL
uniref:Uncharacterized protein n=1 Tax=Anguilla anguilla TaxID=7936 RepID=A0A0E9TQS9_ANGAN